MKPELASKKMCKPQQYLQRFLPSLFTGAQPAISTKVEDINWTTLPTNSEVSFAVFPSIESIFEFWQSGLYNQNLLLDFAYLQNLEQHPIKDYEPYYFLFKYRSEILGVAYCQLLHIAPDENIDLGVDNSLRQRFRKWLAGKLRFQMLICGNLMFSGEHGFSFNPSQCSRTSFLTFVKNAMELFAQSKTNVHLLGIKDLEEPSATLNRNGFSAFTFLPSMTMPLDPDWQNMEDYLEALTSKYRVRAKRAFKKAKQVAFLELNQEQILEQEKQIISLYKAVVEQASFNVVHIPENYFSSFKQTFPDAFRLFACYQNQHLVGFYTTFRNGHTLEAHYLGLDHEANKPNQLYLNMLFKMIEVGIEEGVKEIAFARTSMAIKSSVGAKPISLYNYVRHRHPFWNLFIARLIQFLEPCEEWKARHPFKTTSESGE